ncbi:MAG: flippase-like domain-containing protein [Actinomycetota bacterium]|nr:flippase-like domain-containing protein [Actinomycetota bacterium]
MKVRLPRTRAARVTLVLPVIVATVALVVWRGPDLGPVERAFRAVAWEWVVLAVLVNLASIVVRAIAWKIVVDQAVPPPRPRKRNVFAAFCVGLLANAALPGRVGELARVIVLTRRMRRRPGTWATVVGTVFTHRLFDVVAAVGLVVYVLYTARIPNWAVPGLAIFLGIGVGLLLAALLLARRQSRLGFDEIGPVRRMLRMGRYGLAVLKHPAPAVGALLFQLLGWAAQLFAVWAAFRAFGIDGSFPMAAVVLVLMNLVIAFPLWPGNVGLMQAAIALSLLTYGVAYAHGFAFGIGLQAIEVSVGVALGLLFLAREGFSFAMLRRMPEVTEVEVDERVERIA